MKCQGNDLRINKYMWIRVTAWFSISVLFILLLCREKRWIIRDNNFCHRTWWPGWTQPTNWSGPAHWIYRYYTINIYVFHKQVRWLEYVGCTSSISGGCTIWLNFVLVCSAVSQWVYQDAPLLLLSAFCISLSFRQGLFWLVWLWLHVRYEQSSNWWLPCLVRYPATLKGYFCVQCTKIAVAEKHGSQCTLDLPTLKYILLCMPMYY